MMSSRWVIIQVILRQLQREKHEETNDTEERGDIQGEKDSNRIVQVSTSTDTEKCQCKSKLLEAGDVDHARLPLF